MVEVTINYKANADDKYGSDVTFLVETKDYDTAVVTAIASFRNKNDGATITYMTAKYKENLLVPCDWTLHG